MKKAYIKGIGAAVTVLLSSASHAAMNSGVYVAADAGIFQASFNQRYLDQTDVIAQNIGESVQQHGYTAGLAVGYQKWICSQYFLGAELSGNLDSREATFQSGASTTAFSDSIQVRNHIDLTFVPGMLLGNSMTAYLKLGISSASINDNLSSPVGFIPTSTVYNSTRRVTGFAAGIGVSKYLTQKISLFVEANYHDYGRVSFPSFQNFSASYTHTAQIYTYGAIAGLAYHF